MNEKLEVALAEIINTTLQAKDFVLEQAPDVIHQLLAWKLTVNLIVFVVGALFLIYGIGALCKGIIGGIDKCEWNKNDALVATGCISIIVSSFLVTNLTWLQIWIAPKVYLLEYAAQLIK